MITSSHLMNCIPIITNNIASNTHLCNVRPPAAPFWERSPLERYKITKDINYYNHKDWKNTSQIASYCSYDKSSCLHPPYVYLGNSVHYGFCDSQWGEVNSSTNYINKLRMLPPLSLLKDTYILCIIQSFGGIFIIQNIENGITDSVYKKHHISLPYFSQKNKPFWTSAGDAGSLVIGYFVYKKSEIQKRCTTECCSLCSACKNGAQTIYQVNAGQDRCINTSSYYSIFIYQYIHIAHKRHPNGSADIFSTQPLILINTNRLANLTG